MKMNIKKVATVLGSALMLGATAGMAAAAAYPAPFVSNGAANVAIVVGGNAALSDGLAASAIAADLATDLAAQTATSATTSGTTVTGGDSYTFEKSTQKLWIGNDASDIKSSLNEEQMPILLADGKYLDSDSEEYDFNQKITIADGLNLSLFSDADYAKDTPTIGFKVDSGDQIVNYTLEFDDQVAFNKIETTDLSIMGKTYYVLDVTDSNRTLTLLDSADTLTVSEGEAKTVTVNGKSYEISLEYVAETKAKLTVNGQTTNNLAEGATQKLTDGAYVGIKSIMYSSKDSGVSKVEFSIGSGKLMIQSGSEVQMNDEVITDLYGYIVNASTNLDQITLQWKADGDQFIAADKELVMPGFGAVKFSFGGVNYPKSEKIVVEADGRDSIVLSDFPLKDGAADINLIYSNETAFVGLGKSSDELLVTGTTSVTFDANNNLYFVGSWSDGKTGESSLLRASNFRTVDSTDRVTIQQYKDGAWTNVKEDRQVNDTFTIGNLDLKVTGIDRTNRKANISNDANSEVSFNVLYSKEGMKIALPTTSVINATNVTTSYALNFTEEDEDEQYTGTTHSFVLTLGLNDQSPKRADVEAIVGAQGGLEIGTTEVDQYVIYSGLATDIKYDRSGDQDSVEITYHGAESFGDLVISAPQATVTAGSGSTGSATQLGAITIKDSEVSSVSGKNLIVIGGSCVNSVAAELLGGAACEAAFTAASGVKAGEALIKSFARGDKVALLVAGYNAEDTTKAATYLTMKGADTTVGTALKVTSATEATAITA